MGLSWLCIVLQSKASLVQLPVRAQALVVGLVPGWGVFERQPSDVSLTH